MKRSKVKPVSAGLKTMHVLDLKGFDDIRTVFERKKLVPELHLICFGQGLPFYVVYKEGQKGKSFMYPPVIQGEKAPYLKSRGK